MRTKLRANVRPRAACVRIRTNALQPDWVSNPDRKLYMALAVKMPIGRWSVGAAVADDALVRFNLAKRIGEPWKKVVVESGLAVVLAFALFVWRRSRKAGRTRPAALSADRD